MTTHARRFALCSLAGLVLGCASNEQAQMASQAPIGKAQGPVAISALSSGTIVVLGGRGRLSLIDSNSGTVTLLKDSLGYFSPADMAAVHLGDGDSIFIALYNSVQQQQGVLAKYSLSGAQLQTWSARASFAGIAIDQVHHTVYIGDAVTGEISSFSADGNSTSPSFLVEVSGVARLG